MDEMHEKLGNYDYHGFEGYPRHRSMALTHRGQQVLDGRNRTETKRSIPVRAVPLRQKRTICKAGISWYVRTASLNSPQTRLASYTAAAIPG